MKMIYTALALFVLIASFSYANPLKDATSEIKRDVLLELLERLLTDKRSAGCSDGRYKVGLDDKGDGANSLVWLCMNGDIATVGMKCSWWFNDDDVVKVTLPKIGDVFKQNEQFGIVESMWKPLPVYLPVDGEIIDIHSSIVKKVWNLSCSNDDENDWLVKIKVTNKNQLSTLLV